MENKNYDPAAPVAWRWREPNATTWVYDPDPKWLAEHRHEVEAEPLYAHPTPLADAVAVSIQPMKLSGNRTEYYVALRVGDREVTPYKFEEEWKAAYEVATFNWLFNGGEKPELFAFDPAIAKLGSK